MLMGKQRQLNATGICNRYSTDYKERLIHLCLLLPMFTQVLDLLLLSKITIFLGSELSKACARKQNSRRQAPTFHIPNLKTQFVNSSFICRTLRLANGLLPENDISEPVGPKKAPLEYFILVFLATCNESTPCTRLILCHCPNYEDQQTAI